MDKLEIFKQDFKLYHTAHQSHIKYCVDVPEHVEMVSVNFQYGPISTTDQESLERALLKEGHTVDLIEKNTNFRNLLTLSINDSQTFRGAHHCFQAKQMIEISTTEASFGFIAGEIPVGEWQVILSCHGIFADFVQGSISVEVTFEIGYQHSYQKAVPLTLGGQPQGRIINRSQSAPGLTFQRAELHTHTHHSDASQSTESLIQQALNEGIRVLAITDHNTTSPLFEARKITAKNDANLLIIPGMEYTTFHGHMVVHGNFQALQRNWTELNRANFHQILDDLAAKDLVVTIAHPFDMGNPYCTGCRWDYQIENLSQVDAIEVWNSPNPHLSATNQQSYQKWLNLIQQGYDINATAGRDWHSPMDSQEPVAFTYILLPDQPADSDLIEALKLGRTYASLRPQFESLIVNGKYQLGDRIPKGTTELELQLSVSELEPGDQIILYWDDQSIKFDPIQDQPENIFQVNYSLDQPAKQFIRLEIIDGDGHLITWTNPIYIEH